MHTRRHHKGGRESVPAHTCAYGTVEGKQNICCCSIDGRGNSKTTTTKERATSLLNGDTEWCGARRRRCESMRVRSIQPTCRSIFPSFVVSAQPTLSLSVSVCVWCRVQFPPPPAACSPESSERRKPHDRHKVDQHQRKKKKQKQKKNMKQTTNRNFVFSFRFRPLRLLTVQVERSERPE